MCSALYLYAKGSVDTWNQPLKRCSNAAIDCSPSSWLSFPVISCSAYLHTDALESGFNVARMSLLIGWDFMASLHKLKRNLLKISHLFIRQCYEQYLWSRNFNIVHHKGAPYFETSLLKSIGFASVTKYVMNPILKPYYDCQFMGITIHSAQLALINRFQSMASA